jgi:hypothetical protein
LIIPNQFGLDAVLVAKAITAYADDPARREGLAKKTALPERALEASR